MTFKIGNSIRKTHGGRKLPEYNVWHQMKKRCLSKSCKEFHYYGGRGIRVCDRWINSFEMFLLDMGRRPSNKHSIDRKDVNGDYTPENCRWVTMKVQGNNKRSNVFIEACGKRKTITEWALELKCHPSSINGRIKSGMTPFDAVTKPIKRCLDIRTKEKILEMWEQGMKYKEIAKTLNCNYFTTYDTINPPATRK